jgi:hypothetical protein
VPTRDRHPIGGDYQLMVSALADVTRRRDTEWLTAELAYRDSADKAAGRLSRMEGDADRAVNLVGVAASQVLDVDREAARLWEQLRGARGIRLHPLGELPEPAAIETLPKIPTPRGSAHVLLARAAERIDDTVRPAGRRPLPRWALALLPLLGILIAAATSLLAAGLVTFGGTAIPGAAVVRGLGWLAFLIAPSSGVPVAAVLFHRRLQARLDIDGIGLTLLGGMLAATPLSWLFALSQ